MKTYADRHDDGRRKRRRNSSLNRFRDELAELDDDQLQFMVDAPNDYVNDIFNQFDLGQESALQSAHLITEDELSEAEGLMGKSEFLELAEESVRTSLQESFKGTGFTEKDCPWLKHLFRHYGRRNAKYLEHSFHKYLPGTKQAESVEEYIAPLGEKVQRAIAAWMKTGQITEVPAEIPRSLMRVAGQDAANQRARMGKGKQLDSSTKSKMEGAFGSSIGDVKVHTENEGSAFAEELDAQAATIGKDIAFGAGKYKPGTPEGDALIAHELAHVMQQQGATETGEMGSGADYSAMEQDAEGATRGVLGRLWGGMKSSFADLKANAWPRLKSGLQVQRCETEVPESADNLEKLSIELNNTNVDEVHVLELLRLLSEDEKLVVLDESEEYLQLMANALSADEEMTEALSILNADFMTTLRWLVKCAEASSFDYLSGATVENIVNNATDDELIELSHDDQLLTDLKRQLVGSWDSYRKIEVKMGEAMERKVAVQREENEASDIADGKKWHWWTVPDPGGYTPIRDKEKGLATEYSDETKEDSPDLTDGSPYNKKRWLNLEQNEVSVAMAKLNPERASLSQVKTGDKIRVPTPSYWYGKSLVYYSNYKPNETFYRRSTGEEVLFPIITNTAYDATEIDDARMAADEYMKDVSQELTISEASSQGKALEQQETLERTRQQTASSEIDNDTYFGRMNRVKSPVEWAMWISRKLGPYNNQLKESAKANNIPTQLLAAIIINEMDDLDINDEDQNFGSIGISQIQPDTAFEHNLIDITDDEAYNAFVCEYGTGDSFSSIEDMIAIGKRILIKQRLLIPQVAIEATAREIAFQLTETASYLDNEWAKKFEYTATAPLGIETYDYIGGATQLIKEANLANMVAAEYNSPDIKKAKYPLDIENYKNALPHGATAAENAMRLYQFNLFHEN